MNWLWIDYNPKGRDWSKYTQGYCSEYWKTYIYDLIYYPHRLSRFTTQRIDTESNNSAVAKLPQNWQL